jgi:hypothetical protein
MVKGSTRLRLSWRGACLGIMNGRVVTLFSAQIAALAGGGSGRAVAVGVWPDGGGVCLLLQHDRCIDPPCHGPQFDDESSHSGSLLVLCVPFGEGGGSPSRIFRPREEVQLHTRQSSTLLSKIHVFATAPSATALPLWAVEAGGGLRGYIFTQGTCKLPPSASQDVGSITSLTCSSRLCCFTRSAAVDDRADTEGQCWFVTLDESSLCSNAYHLPASASSPSLYSELSLCNDDDVIYVLAQHSPRFLSVVAPLPPPQAPIIHHTSRIPPHASHVVCAPAFSLLWSSSTGFFLPPPPLCPRSAACHPPVHHASTPIPSATGRGLACALHPSTLTLMCWGDAPIAGLVPHVVVCVFDAKDGCMLALVHRGVSAFHLAPRLYDSSHSDGRFLDIVPISMNGLGNAVCNSSSSDFARISVLSVSFSSSDSACDVAPCSCTMLADACA